MKRIIIILVVAAMLTGLTACAGNTPANAGENVVTTGKNEQAEPSVTDKTPSSGASETAQKPEETLPATESVRDGATAAKESEPLTECKSVLVVVFSATGTTKGVAEKIAAIENADLYEIKAAKQYTSADLNYNDRNSRTTKEQNDSSVRPEIGSERVSLEGYEKIYIGFPIWWGEEPRIMDTFVESYDFGGITMIPFCTSSSSGIGRSGKNLADNAKSGKWLDGRRFSGSDSEPELRSWIDGLK